MSTGQGEGTPPPPPPPSPKDPLAELDAWARSIGAQEKNQGKAAAERAIAEQLGMTPTEAAEFIKNAKAKQREGLEEAERKLLEASEKTAAAEKKVADAAVRELNAATRIALIEQGIPKDQAATVARLLDLVPADWDDAKVTNAVESLKKSMPQLFTPTVPVTETRQSARPPHSSTGGAPPAGGQVSPAERSLALLRERHPELVQKE